MLQALKPACAGLFKVGMGHAKTYFEAAVCMLLTHKKWTPRTCAG